MRKIWAFVRAVDVNKYLKRTTRKTDRKRGVSRNISPSQSIHPAPAKSTSWLRRCVGRPSAVDCRIATVSNQAACLAIAMRVICFFDPNRSARMLGSHPTMSNVWPCGRPLVYLLRLRRGDHQLGWKVLFAISYLPAINAGPVRLSRGDYCIV